MLELNFTPFPDLSTERLQLTYIDRQDAHDLFKLRTDIDAMRFLGKPIPRSIDEIYELIDRMENAVNSHTGIGWGMRLKGADTLIGTIGFHRIIREHFRAEIGYMLLPAFWNNGLMSEAMQKILLFGFDQMHLHSVEANVDPTNEASIKLLKKFGFVKEAYFRENYYFQGQFLDSEIYSLIRENALNL